MLFRWWPVMNSIFYIWEILVSNWLWFTMTIFKVQFRLGLVSSLFSARTHQSFHENLNVVGGGLQCNAVSPEPLCHEDRGSPSPSGASLKMSCGYVIFHSSRLSLGLSWNLFHLPDEAKWDDLKKNVWQVSPKICENTMIKFYLTVWWGIYS